MPRPISQARRVALAQSVLLAAVTESQRILSGGEPTAPVSSGRPDGSMLVSMTRIASRLDIGRNTVYNWSTRYPETWPEPVCGEGKHAVYWWPDVVRFMVEHGLPGR
jgi:hypothetical protein